MHTQQQQKRFVKTNYTEHVFVDVDAILTFQLDLL